MDRSVKAHFSAKMETVKKVSTESKIMKKWEMGDF